MIEEAIWSAVRALHEKEALLRRTAEIAAGSMRQTSMSRPQGLPQSMHRFCASLCSRNRRARFPLFPIRQTRRIQGPPAKAMVMRAELLHTLPSWQA